MTYKDKFWWFYNTKEWKALRARKFYDADGLCEMCWQNGVVEQAKEIHHIIPIEKDWNKRLDYNNLISLCSQHHNEQHERVSELQKFLKEFDK